MAAENKKSFADRLRRHAANATLVVAGAGSLAPAPADAGLLDGIKAATQVIGAVRDAKDPQAAQRRAEEERAAAERQRIEDERRRGINNQTNCAVDPQVQAEIDRRSAAARAISDVTKISPQDIARLRELADSSALARAKCLEANRQGQYPQGQYPTAQGQQMPARTPMGAPVDDDLPINNASSNQQQPSLFEANISPALRRYRPTDLNRNFQFSQHALSTDFGKADVTTLFLTSLKNRGNESIQKYGNHADPSAQKAYKAFTEAQKSLSGYFNQPDKVNYMAGNYVHSPVSVDPADDKFKLTPLREMLNDPSIKQDDKATVLGGMLTLLRSGSYIPQGDKTEEYALPCRSSDAAAKVQRFLAEFPEAARIQYTWLEPAGEKYSDHNVLKIDEKIFIPPDVSFNPRYLDVKTPTASKSGNLLEYLKSPIVEKNTSDGIYVIDEGFSTKALEFVDRGSPATRASTLTCSKNGSYSR